MKLTIEVEVVVLEGRLSDRNYYGFKIVDGPKDKYGFDPTFVTSDSRYPGNDAMREFFNLRAARNPSHVGQPEEN